ncbi:substrate-binding protein [Hoeflea sp.]|uniref:substrate-binding protein n=1 Tax=Hoeflea sp. TaxID=1940281 RepID=UPI003B02B76F
MNNEVGRVPKDKRLSRRRFLVGSGALAAAGWTAGSEGWVLKPAWASADGPIKIGVATAVTGPQAAAGMPAWQTVQFTVQQINDAGGILGRPVQLFLEDTASDPGIAVGNVRRLIQRHKVDVIVGGITSAMREAIKNPIVHRGKTLYLYPTLYEGQECTEHLYVTGPTPAQQCAELLPYLIRQGAKRFAMPSANYRWPQLLNKRAREIIEQNGGEVVMEEYYPLDQLEYSATVAKILSEKADHVFCTVIPPGVQAFTKQLHEAGFHDRGGSFSCVYYDEIAPNYVSAQTLEGAYSCLDYFHAVEDPFSQKLLADYNEMFPGTVHQFTAGSTSTGMYRALKLYEQAVIATNGDLAREVVSEAFDSASIEQGPGGPARIVPGTGHVAMNMYVAQAQGDNWNILSKAEMVDPAECA